MTVLLLALLAGTVTTLSPCVLPVVPLVLVGALQQHRLAPLALVGGMAVTFTILGTALVALGAAVGPHDGVRQLSAALMIVFGFVLLSTRTQGLFARALAPLGARLGNATTRFAPDGVAGHAVLGMLLGAVWMPCSGPTLGAAMGLAASGQDPARALAVMLTFSVGAGLPMLALAYGSRQALMARRERLARFAAWSKPALGAILMLLGVAVMLDLDRTVEAQLVARMPDWLLELTTRY
jgi:cytochrome c-type biogenesis protein